MTLAPLDIIALVITGILAGSLGGMLGIGGSIIMIPAMSILFSRDPWHSQHLYQAAAMVVNAAVAIPATVKHRRSGNIRPDLFKFMLPAAIVACLLGVLASNLFDTASLKRLFAAFLGYVVLHTLAGILRRRPDHDPARARVTPTTGGGVGAVMGFIAGLLGVGGGIIAVPLAQMWCKIPFRQAVGASASVMCITAIVGAALKLSTLPQHDDAPRDALVLALVLAPTALLGGYLGASLTGRVPLTALRAVFSVVLLGAALRMSGLA